jgi:hypothetical protein
VSTDVNKAVVRSFVEAWNTKDFDRFDELMAEDTHLCRQPSVQYLSYPGITCRSLDQPPPLGWKRGDERLHAA